MKNILHDESGVALLVAVGVLAIISILGIAILTTAKGSIDQTVSDRSTNQAFGVAEAGFNDAVFKVRQNGLAAGTYRTTLKNGEAEIVITGSDSIYKIRSTGAVPSLDATNARKRAIEGQVSSINAYDMIFSSGGGGNGAIKINGNAEIWGQVYCSDKLDLGGAGGKIHDGPIYIKDNLGTPSPTGDLALSGASTIGAPGEEVLAYIDGSISGIDNLYASAIYSDVPDLTMPSVETSDMPAYRAKASTSGVIIDDNCVTEGSEDLDLDGSVSSFTTETADGTYYLRWTVSGSGNNKTADLEINGTIFVDGNVSIGNNNGSKDVRITYTGKGAIVSNGSFSVLSQLMPAGCTPGATETFPSQNILGFVSPYTGLIHTKTDKYVYGTFYALNEFKIDKSMIFFGTAISRQQTISNTPKLHIIPTSADLPDGMPAVEPLTTLTSWREVSPY